MSKKKRAATILSIDISTTMSMSGCSDIKSSKEISFEQKCNNSAAQSK